MAPLEFALLGHPSIGRDGEQVISPARVRVFALGAYLAADCGQPCPREPLAGLLWPDQDEARARHNLRQALSTLRRCLEPDGEGHVLVIRREAITLREGACHVDARRLGDLLDTCDVHRHPDPTNCPACLARLEQACALYSGPFLDGFSMPGSDLYDEWQMARRQHLHQRVVDALGTLATASLNRGDHDRAIRVSRRQLELDPLQETPHRNLMRAYTLAGNRSAALHQFDTLTRLLDDELGLGPDPETIALLEAIRAGIDPLPAQGDAVVNRTSPSPLPVPSSRLVGREKEREEIIDLLGERDCRLLTLHGPGGCGKTRLAIEIARDYAASSGDLVAFVQLAGETDREGTITTIISALGLAPRGPDPPEKQLLSWMRERPVFLILDNAEHLIHALGFIETMLTTAPGLTILVTSRERLGLPGEWIYDLAGLTWPKSVDDDSPEGYGAVALVAERIQQVRSGAGIAHTEQPDLVRICQMVEGMPLALEMAASWATTLSPGQIADGIRERLDFLEASSPQKPDDRHRSMRAVIQSSWARLSPDIQVTFRRLSVFDDGFTLDAATQVAETSPRALAILVNASLLTHRPSGRYVMHGLLAHFAAEKLMEHERERIELVRRHARYYLALVAGQERDLNGVDQPSALRTIGDDLTNVLTAWEWAIDHGDIASLLDSVSTLWLYYVLRGQMHAGAQTFGRLLSATRQEMLPDVAGHDLLTAMAYSQLGGFISGLGRYDEAISLLSTGLARFRTLISGRSISVTLNMLAAAELLRGNHESARDHLQESLDEAERVQDRWSIAFAVNDLGMLLHLHFGDPDAEGYCDRGRRLFQQTGDVRGEALAAYNLGVMAALAGDAHRALAIHQEALSLREALGDMWGVAASLVRLGSVSAIAGDDPAARRYLQRALHLAWESSMLPIVLEALVELAAIDLTSESAHTVLLAVSRHPAVQDPVRLRCENLLTSMGEAPRVDPTTSDDLWAIRTVDHVARNAAIS